MIKTCDYSECTRKPQFLMSWDNKNGKHFGLVCATHDRFLGRRNLVEAGMPIDEAIAFEKYCFLTVNDANPIDWPKWFEVRTGKAPTPLASTTKARQPVKSQPHSTKLILLGLPPRVWNVLRRNDITTIEQLTSMDDHELLKLRTIGKTALSEIHKSLNESGYG